MLIDGEIINAYGMTETLRGNMTREQASQKASKNCKQCYGRGLLDFDDGKVIVTDRAEYRLMSKWTAACGCVEKVMELTSDKAWHSKHPSSKRPIFAGKK